MAIPSGGGTEVLKSICTSVTAAYTLTPTQHHIYTILNIVIKNNHTANFGVDIDISNDSGSSYVFLMEDQNMLKDETFVWNEKLVLYDNTARLRVGGFGSDNAHITINYIDQDWS